MVQEQDKWGVGEGGCTGIHGGFQEILRWFVGWVRDRSKTSGVLGNGGVQG
jgi:hypothetical protein